MTRRFRPIPAAFVAVCAAATLLLPAADAAAQSWSRRCELIARSYLMDHGIAAADVLDTQVLERLDPGGTVQRLRPEISQREAVSQGLISGFTVRVRLKTCDGTLLFEMGPQCQIRDLQGRGDCEVPPSAEVWPEED